MKLENGRDEDGLLSNKGKIMICHCPGLEFLVSCTVKIFRIPDCLV